jgi:hypothetical protein
VLDLGPTGVLQVSLDVRTEGWHSNLVTES